MPERKRGSGALRRPGSSRHRAGALGGSGSAHRAGWFRGEYVCCLRQQAPFGGWRHHLRPSGKRVTGFSVAQGLPTNPVPLPRPLRGGTMDAGQWHQFEFMAAAERKPYNLAALVEMHPFCRLRRRLSTGKRLTRFSGHFCSPTNHVRLPPRRGRFALRSAFVLISILRHNAAKTSPSGGGAVGRRGAFPAGAARLYGFSFREAEL